MFGIAIACIRLSLLVSCAMTPQVSSAARGDVVPFEVATLP